MGSKLFVMWAAIRGVLLMLVIATAVKAPAGELPAEPPKPILVWEGISSWYGSDFHGRATASGEKYNMFAPTAAHPTLPLGSLVRLVYADTGRSMLVRINDRGPFIEGREIDVSYEVARSLGFEERGLARLRIELLEVSKRPWRARKTKN